MLKALLLAFQYFPIVLSGVTAIEQTIGSSAPGATKKQILLDSIVATAKVGEGVPESHVSAISGLIDVVVTALNISGVFKSKAASDSGPGAPLPPK